jgi:hypothetical protein
MGSLKAATEYDCPGADMYCAAAATPSMVHPGKYWRRGDRTVASAVVVVVVLAKASFPEANEFEKVTEMRAIGRKKRPRITQVAGFRDALASRRPRDVRASRTKRESLIAPRVMPTA